MRSHVGTKPLWKPKPARSPDNAIPATLCYNTDTTKEETVPHQQTATLQCELCPRRCRLAPGQTGACHARRNTGGRIEPIAPNRVCAVNIDPIEKKPLYHVAPGAPILSVARAGCTLHCKMCQNSEISQRSPEKAPGQDLPPGKLGDVMRSGGCAWTAYTYTEPFAWPEYLTEGCDSVIAAQGRNAIITSAFASADSVRAVAPKISAANVDLKSMSDRFYREFCGGLLQPVLDNLRILKDSDVFIEITNLIIPGLNDDIDELKTLASWILDNLGPGTPLHFSRFYPCHKLQDIPPTPLSTLKTARRTALSLGLRHVYIGNASMPEANTTYCHNCDAPLIRRDTYRVTRQDIPANGECPHCSTPISGIWL